MVQERPVSREDPSAAPLLADRKTNADIAEILMKVSKCFGNTGSSPKTVIVIGQKGRRQRRRFTHNRSKGSLAKVRGG
jgi:hypothetical protein